MTIEEDGGDEDDPDDDVKKLPSQLSRVFVEFLLFLIVPGDGHDDVSPTGVSGDSGFLGDWCVGWWSPPMSGVSGGGVPPASRATGGDVLPTSGVSGVGVTGASGARFSKLRWSRRCTPWII
ncbi:unnamed protein product [Microthlaspi erraticum]|uniref:Uncharacterized protein n=1 Tax=Microthlaspi erraticum TaxID=1685480 RepID=A0A6D2HUZ5_9BRAS|nr:unnamed protein product [Microthlaspi erraticum]